MCKGVSKKDLKNNLNPKLKGKYFLAQTICIMPAVTAITVEQHYLFCVKTTLLTLEMIICQKVVRTLTVEIPIPPPRICNH
jgi:hypothetical protein